MNVPLQPSRWSITNDTFQHYKPIISDFFFSRIYNKVYRPKDSRLFLFSFLIYHLSFIIYHLSFRLRRRSRLSKAAKLPSFQHRQVVQVGCPVLHDSHCYTYHHPLCRMCLRVAQFPVWPNADAVSNTADICLRIILLGWCPTGNDVPDSPQLVLPVVGMAEQPKRCSPTVLHTVKLAESPLSAPPLGEYLALPSVT